MSPSNPPPRLLLGATLLFWGAITGRPMVGLLLAILVESPQWIRWRWDFDDEAIARAWQIVIALGVGMIVLMLVDGEREQLAPNLINWLPALLLPLQLAQTYGLRSSIPLSALSLFAKRRKERNQRLGLEQPEVTFHFGNVYFAVALLSSAMGEFAEGRLFLPGLLVLCAWRFLALPKRRVTAILIVFVCAGSMAILGQSTLNRLYDWFSKGGRDDRSWMSDAAHGFTAIGSMRDLKLSSDIRWRLRVEPRERPPALLRRAAFNRYRATSWEISRSADGLNADQQFTNLDTIEPTTGEEYYLANPRIDTQAAISGELARFSMRGSTPPGGAMPLPGSVASFGKFDLDAAQRNPLSTVRVIPASPVIDGFVLWQADEDPDGEPIWDDDLRIPPLESEMLARVAESVGLVAEMSTGEKLARVKSWMQREFSYSLYLSTSHQRHFATQETAIGHFLETSRQGHCEYFATATALLLRAVGVPTRYTTGYAVIERDPKRGEFIIRGTHSHAWCRVWIDEETRWIDFDSTPADWFAMEQIGKISWLQRAYDFLKRMREDFFIWRTDPKNREMLLMIIIIPGALGGIWIGWRLWKSRNRDGITEFRRSSGCPSPLLEIESLASRHLGPRPAGIPFATWLLPLGQRLNGSCSSLHEAIVLHQQLRFDPDMEPADATEKLDSILRELRPAIRALEKQSKL